ncbi:MAG: aldo/keto reductase [Beutenbergiaceae bacterium]
MDYNQLGASGLTVSGVGLGCNSFGVTVAPDRVPAVVDSALAAGITLFDTADIYGARPGQSEELLGSALGRRRDEVVVATKFGMDMAGANGPDWGVRGSRRYIRRAVEASLRRLGTDYIDLYQIHAFDPLTPVGETVAALSELVTEGKVRYLGTSNFTGWQIVDADWNARAAGLNRFVAGQNAYSLLDRGVESEVLPALRHVGAGLLAYYPLASGLLTGKYRRGLPAPAGSRLTRRPERLRQADFDTIEAIEAFAAARDLPVATVAIGFLAAQDAVASVLCGASAPDQVTNNVAALSWHVSTADRQELAALSG